MNRLFAAIALSATALSGCGFSGPTPREILEQPREFHGRDVTIEGTVENVRSIAESGVFGYTIVAEADSLLVLDPEAPAPVEDVARVSGRVHMRFFVEGRPRVVLLRGLDS